MRPEHRHELKTNELAEWLANLPQWARKNRKMIIYVSVVAALVIGSGFFHWYRKNIESVREQVEFTNLIASLPASYVQILQAQQSRDMDISYILIQAADRLQAAAIDAKRPPMAALALIKQAEALRAELHYRQETISSQDIELTINQAKAAYTKAMEKARAYPSLMARAKLGLALCQEELGNIDSAKQIYKEVIENSDFEGTIAVEQAKQRLLIISASSFGEKRSGE